MGKVILALIALLSAGQLMAQTCPDTVVADQFRRTVNPSGLLSLSERNELDKILQHEIFRPYGTVLSLDDGSTHDTYVFLKAMHSLHRCSDGRRKVLRLSARTYVVKSPIPVVSRLSIQGSGLGKTVVVNSRPVGRPVDKIKRVIFLSGSTHPQMLQNRNANTVPLSEFPQKIAATAGLSQIHLPMRAGQFAALKAGDLLHIADFQATVGNAGLLPFKQEVLEVKSVRGNEINLAAPIQKNYVRATVRLFGTGGPNHRNRVGSWFMEKDIQIQDLSTRGFAMMQESGVLRGKIKNVEHVGFKGVTVNLVKNFIFDQVDLKVKWRGLELKGFCDSVRFVNGSIQGFDQQFSAIRDDSVAEDEKQKPLLSIGERCRNVEILQTTVTEGSNFYLSNKVAVAGESVTLRNLTYQAKSAGRFLLFQADQDVQISVDGIRLNYSPDPRYAGQIRVLRASAIKGTAFHMRASLKRGRFNDSQIPDSLIRVIQASQPANINLEKD